jgi:hypothetical protein
MKKLAILAVAAVIVIGAMMAGCASTGPVITKKGDGTVKFENRSYTIGPAQLTGASNDFSGSYEIRPDGTVIIHIDSGQAVENMTSQSPIQDITELVAVIKTP